MPNLCLPIRPMVALGLAALDVATRPLAALDVATVRRSNMLVNTMLVNTMLVVVTLLVTYTMVLVRRCPHARTVPTDSSGAPRASRYVTLGTAVLETGHTFLPEVQTTEKGRLMPGCTLDYSSRPAGTNPKTSEAAAAEDSSTASTATPRTAATAAPTTGTRPG